MAHLADQRSITRKNTIFRTLADDGTKTQAAISRSSDPHKELLSRDIGRTNIHGRAKRRWTDDVNDAWSKRTVVKCIRLARDRQQ